MNLLGYISRSGLRRGSTDRQQVGGKVNGKGSKVKPGKDALRHQQSIRLRPLTTARIPLLNKVPLGDTRRGKDRINALNIDCSAIKNISRKFNSSTLCVTEMFHTSTRWIAMNTRGDIPEARRMNPIDLSPNAISRRNTSIYLVKDRSIYWTDGRHFGLWGSSEFFILG